MDTQYVLSTKVITMVKNKNNKDIDHLVLFTTSFFEWLAELQVLVLEPRALQVRLRGCTTELHIPSCPVFLLPYINCILLLPLLFKPELRMSAFFPGA